MSQTLYLDPTIWDLTVDANGDIAVADNPYQLAQDAATAMRTWLGEVYYDTTLGLPYRTQILGQSPPLSLVRAQLEAAAMTVDGVVAVNVALSSSVGRVLSGQVTVTDQTGATASTNF